MAKGSEGKERREVAIAVGPRQRDPAMGGRVARALERGGKRLEVARRGQLDQRLADELAAIHPEHRGEALVGVGELALGRDGAGALADPVQQDFDDRSRYRLGLRESL